MDIKNIFGLMLLLIAMLGAPAFAGKVDINKADVATLTGNLKGIGPVKAKAIIDYRKKNGSFKSLDDLLKVPGIGEAIIKKNRSNLSLKGGLSKSVAKSSASGSATVKKTEDTKKSVKEASSSDVKKAKEAEAKAKAAKEKAAKAKAAKEKAAKAKAAKEKAAKKEAS